MTEPVTVLNLIAMPAKAADAFVDAWPANSAALADAPGFRGTRLLRAISPDDPYQVVNVAQWDSVEQWRTALSGVQSDSERRRLAEAAGITPQHFFYHVVSVTPDPVESAATPSTTVVSPS
jgi:heme-degrading monooxygenase HmoA